MAASTSSWNDGGSGTATQSYGRLSSSSRTWIAKSPEPWMIGRTRIRGLIVRKSSEDTGDESIEDSTQTTPGGRLTRLLFHSPIPLLYISVTSWLRESDGSHEKRHSRGILVMPGFLHAIRRLFPPLKIRSKLWPSMSLLVLYGLLVSVAVNIEHLPHIEWGAESTVLNGLVLGFLIAFRNNHAYDRWWEARKLWGQLINDSRNLCLKVRALNGIESTDRERSAGS